MAWGWRKETYSRQDFGKLICTRREALSLSLPALAALVGMNRGSLSRIERGLCSCPPEKRPTLLRTLMASSENWDRFCPSATTGRDARSDLVSPPSSPSQGSLAEHGQNLLAQSRFSDAKSVFIPLYLSRVDPLARADVAGRLGWVHYELGQYGEALVWTDEAIDLVAQHTGCPRSELMKSCESTAQLGFLGKSSRETAVLSMALHVRSKILVEQVVHGGETVLFKYADEALAESLLLDTYRGDRAQVGHDQRWRAVLYGGGIHDQAAKRLLEACKGAFPRDSLGEAYLDRDRGFLHWQRDEPGEAERHLRRAAERLADFLDARGLGPTLYMLSRVALQKDTADYTGALCYGLTGAAVHPYGYVLDNVVQLVRNHPEVRSGWASTIEAAESGCGEPFTFTFRVVDRSRLGANLARVERVLRNRADTNGLLGLRRSNRGNGRVFSVGIRRADEPRRSQSVPY